ncbi:hypothetical protein [Mucilaginibacter sp. MD40]|uniref:hypothetical protein n=1 Tax=Mucilaginibacter sp. MD40 TaxID=2029590 RepID=UPI001E35CBDE|nr:hypothetical protein [Mucilaginibacter sp. MD40]
MIIVFPYMRVAGMALFPFILVKNAAFKADAILINHERIHLRQQAELLILPFYILYLLNYVINMLRYRAHYPAYRNIVFEKEAYDHEADMNYLATRKWYRFMTYF